MLDDNKALNTLLSNACFYFSLSVVSSTSTQSHSLSPQPQSVMLGPLPVLHTLALHIFFDVSQVVNSAELASHGHIWLRNILLFCVLLLIYSHNCSH